MADDFSTGLAADLEMFDAEMASMVLDEFKTGWQLDNVMATTRQNKIAEATDRIEWAAIDGIGEVTMRLDPCAYHFWGQKLGYDCWQDKQFKHEFLRDNPEARVRNRRQRTPTFSMANCSPNPISPRQSTATQHTATATVAATTTATTTPTRSIITDASATGAASPSPTTPRIIFP